MSFLIHVGLHGQTRDTPSVIGVAGMDFVNPKGTFHFTIGELAVTDIFEDIRVSQGFYQGFPKTTSITYLEKNSGPIRIFPNPTSDYIIIENDKNKKLDISAFDLTGKLLRSWVLEKQVNRIDISTWPKGVYMIKFSHKNNISQISKIIKI